jgi:hypothetical protein
MIQLCGQPRAIVFLSLAGEQRQWISERSRTSSVTWAFELRANTMGIVFERRFPRRDGGVPDFTSVKVPYPVSVVGWAILAVPLLMIARTHLRRCRRVEEGLCPSCGYDIRATSERCPECGRRVREARKQH